MDKQRGNSDLENSLDWDSPSNKTGTVKRRPISSYSESSNYEEKCLTTTDSDKTQNTKFKPKIPKRINKTEEKIEMKIRKNISEDDSDFEIFDRQKLMETKLKYRTKNEKKSPKRTPMFNRRTLDWVKQNSKQKFEVLQNDVIRNCEENLELRIVCKIPNDNLVSVAKICDTLVS